MKYFNFDFKNSTKLAIITESGCEISYSELTSKSLSIQKLLHPNRLVFCLFDTDEDSIASYISLLNNDNVIFLLNSNISDKLLHILLHEYRPAYIFSKKMIIGMGSGFFLTSYVGRYGVFQSTENLDKDLKINRDLRILISTSGSTGSPKFVRLSEENISSNTNAIIDALRINSKSRTVANLPINYSYGLSVINTFLTAGGTLIINSHSITSNDFWQNIHTHKPNVFHGVPYHYVMLSRLNESFFSSLPFSIFTQAGGKMGESELKKFIDLCSRFSKKLYLMYGQTEATARISILDPNYISSKSPSVGQSIPGGRIEIHSPEGTKINQPNTPGEIIYFGKNVSLGYCQERIDLSKGNDNKFVLKTGDIGYLDSDNFLFITGRKSRFLKYFGNRLSLDDIENILISKFENVACIEVDDNLIIYTQVVLDKIEIRKILFEFLNFKIDFTLKNIKIIPKTESGKIDYYSLRLDYTKVGTF